MKSPPNEPSGLFIYEGWIFIKNANAGHQARLKAGATNEHKLEAIACMSFLDER